MNMNSACDTFMNFQPYHNVHTVVPVWTARGVSQHLVAIQQDEGYLMCYELNTPIYCSSFDDVVREACYAMMIDIGYEAFDEIQNSFSVDLAA